MKNLVTEESRKLGARMSAENDASGIQGYFSLLRSFDPAAFEGLDVFVAMCNIDDLGAVNERLGDVQGSAVLASVGQVMREVFGDEHTCSFGADEFIIVNAFEDESAFRKRIEELFRLVSCIVIDGEALGITLSVGYVYGPVLSSDRLHEAVRLADRKTFEAKRLGKARAVGAPIIEAESGVYGSSTMSSGAYKTYETDELTGLFNLIHFRSQLAETVKQGIGEGDDRLTLIYFNIENFKGFNERFSFESGDELLIYVGDSLREAFPGCPISRFSADQFMVATTQGAAIDGILKVRAAFRKRIKDASIWLKAGVNIVEDGAESIGFMCDRAKLACDTIKGRRDVFYRIYDLELRRYLAHNRYVLDHIDEALEKGWIKIFYQPIMRVASGEICDEEALARWDDPDDGLIPPINFIPVLEEARLIHKLDLYMVRRACENMKRMREDGIEVVPVSINLSRLDFELCDIVSEVENILAEYDVPHNLLTVEVTESALAGNQEFLKSEIDRFRAAGFEVWMDDFGSGYSSLHLLTDYKFDLVKIDMGFLRDFATNEQTRIMLAHIVSMAKELGLKTLVEGVETEEQLAFLKAIGCGRAQGYLLGRPSSLHDVEKASAAEEYPDIERPSSHAFYEAVGRVNLMRPDPVPWIAGHYVPGDMAAAILCREGGTYRYFNVTDIFLVHLEKLGATSIEHATENMNTAGSPARAVFDEVIDRLEGEGDWTNAEYSYGDYTCNLHVHLIARYEEGDMIALLVIAQNVLGVDDPARMR